MKESMTKDNQKSKKEKEVCQNKTSKSNIWARWFEGPRRIQNERGCRNKNVWA